MKDRDRNMVEKLDNLKPYFTTTSVHTRFRSPRRRPGRRVSSAMSAKSSYQPSDQWLTLGDFKPLSCVRFKGTIRLFYQRFKTYKGE